MSARTTCGHELRGLANGCANASLLLRALKPSQLAPNESDWICASRRRSVSGAPLTIFGVANFGRPQLQYDTFDLDKLPTGSVLGPAAQPQIKDPQSLPVNDELKPRSPDNSAERECAEAKRRAGAEGTAKPPARARARATRLGVLHLEAGKPTESSLRTRGWVCCLVICGPRHRKRQTAALSPTYRDDDQPGQDENPTINAPPPP